MSVITLPIQETVSISVNVIASSDPGQPYRLELQPLNNLYVKVNWMSVRPIEWKIGTKPEDVVSMMFDSPAVTMAPLPDLMPDSGNPQSVTMTWPNADLNRTARPNGRSYNYRLHLLVTRNDGVVFPISHDPTVHNEPPIP